MKHIQLAKPSVTGAKNRGPSKFVKKHKRMRIKWQRKEPIDDEHRPLNNRYAGWWYWI